MSRNLNLIERAIIESLVRHKKTISQLVYDVGIEREWTLAILNNLRSKNFISFDGRDYHLSAENISNIKDIDVKGEIVELAGAIINTHLEKDKVLSLAKLSMSDQELEVYMTLKANLESYVNEIKNKRSHDVATRTQRVFLMADTGYENVLSTYLSANL